MRRLHEAWDVLRSGPAPAAPGDRHSIVLDYEPKVDVRWGYDRPAHPELERILASGHERYRARLESFLPFVDDLAAIPLERQSPGSPSWSDGFFGGLDAVALYGTLATEKPDLYLEIGSGSSTAFARRAVEDRGLQTKIVSIDPEPRRDVDAVCDEVIRQRLEDTDPDVFGRLGPGDVLFYDGSHRCFMNSDVVVMFCEVLPRLPPGVLVHVHDIFLPWDYPAATAEWYWSEQYLLACWLLAGGPVDVDLPVFYACTRPDLHRVLAPLWDRFTWAAVPTNGTGIWLRVGS